MRTVIWYLLIYVISCLLIVAIEQGNKDLISQPVKEKSITGDSLSEPYVSINPTEDDLMIYPQYICKSESTAMAKRTWYEQCLSSCQVTPSSQSAQVAVWEAKPLIGTIRYHTGKVSKMQKKSHVNTWGVCDIALVSDVPYIPTAAEVSEWIKRAKTSPNLDTLDSLILMEDPYCNYLSDEYNWGYKIDFVHRTVNVYTDIYQGMYIKDPDTSDMIGALSESYIWGSHFSFWVMEHFDKSTSCYFQNRHDYTCSVDVDTKVAICGGGERVFKYDGHDNIFHTCVGDVYGSSDGTFYQIITDSVQKRSNRVDDRIRLLDDQNINQLVVMINNALASLEQTYCRSTCDIYEALLDDVSTQHHIMETPIGAWHPISINNTISLVSCNPTQNTSIKYPMELCYEDELIKVQNRISGEEYWWGYSQLYITPEDKCNGSMDSFRPTTLALLKNKKPLIFNFWGGRYDLKYPYNSSECWSKEESKAARRSSKWFPQMEYLFTKVNYTFENMTAEISSTVSNWSQIVDNKSDEDRSNNHNILIDVFYSVENVAKGFISVSLSAWDTLLRYKTILVDVLITGILGITIVVVLSSIRNVMTIFSRIRGKDPARPISGAVAYTMPRGNVIAPPYDT